MTRDDLAAMYLDALPYAPYPVQEEALLAWFTHKEGVLVCAPTGTGKTLIAEAVLFEALHLNKVAYYTTPLIALTEQKFRELQDTVVRWGFSPDQVGLVTGNRKVNPDAPIKVVVAEILLNRLLMPTEFDFDQTHGVVMDEFHSFNDPERGVVWELSLSMLPKHVRLMLLSATVGNSIEFLGWLRKNHGRTLQLIQGTERKIPLSFNWVGDQLLAEQLEWMQEGEEERRKTPTLVFCFNRNECWSIAEQLKGKRLLSDGQQKALAARLDEWNWKVGAGPKLKQLLMRGVGVHHAGMLPKYRRRVEELFQQKLLSVCLCTETLAAGINLPARSVVLTTLLKGPPGKKKLVDASSAHQMFGRAGRPQFDTEGYIYAMAHEDDVKIARWKEQYDQIPEDTKDPSLIRAKKKLKKKMPTRRANMQYWNEEQFEKLISAPPLNLVSKGEFPWRLLAYLLLHSPDVEGLREQVKKRLLDQKQVETSLKRLHRMLLILRTGGFVELQPEPPEKFSPVQRVWDIPPEAIAERDNIAPPVTPPDEQVEEDAFGLGVLEDEIPDDDPPAESEQPQVEVPEEEPEPQPQMGSFGALLQQALSDADHDEKPKKSPQGASQMDSGKEEAEEQPYVPVTAAPTGELNTLLEFRTCNPIYATFLLDHLGIASLSERIQALESVLDVPGSILPQVRAPGPDELPPGPLARYRIDALLLERGLATQADLDPGSVEPEFDNFGKPIRRWPLALGDKLRRFFDSEFPGVDHLRTLPVWIVGDLLFFGGDFHKYVTSRDLTKQEGIIFRHLLRFVLLCKEFQPHCPRGEEPEVWHNQLNGLIEQLTAACRAIDPESTDSWLAKADEDPLLQQ
ncbi:MAG: DEAD/DEAH box helicase [Planctomycetaceae bacterium]|nr:DEAD/DEAH box helicase [Planctomycetaceae bacterium]MCB9953367.1 DEAD/DEAH box helicase [Planctomycetaceae bacterium]